MPPDPVTVSAPPVPFRRLQRINPPPDLQQQVASAIEACTKWQPQIVQVGKDDAPPAEFTNEAQVCEVLDRWPLLYNGQELQAVSLGVILAIAVVVVCTVAWVVLRGLLNLLPLTPLARRFVSRAVGGALCGVGLATLSTLINLSRFAAVALQEIDDKALLSWSSAAPWSAAVFSLLFVLSAVPSAWPRRMSPTATR